MKLTIFITITILLFLGCSKEPQVPKTHFVESGFDELPNWDKENYDEALSNFLNSCKSKKTKKIYKEICKKAENTKDAKLFIQQEFSPYKIYTKNLKGEGLLTGYYEPELQGSLKKTEIFKYPIYETPEDLIIVDLSSIYPDLKHYRLRGKLKGNKLIPYDTRKESASKHIPAKIICFTDSKINLFFLEIQGSGRVTLRDGKTIFIGYGNQNGHKYRAIGKYLVKIGALELEEVSLQTIRAWLDRNPLRVNEVLNYNKSVVYFKQRKKSASGSLGLCLTPMRSIAVDRRYIPLGSMLYLNADIKGENVSKIVLAQDTGGAIKGAVRADMFLGYGKDAMNIAGELKSPLKLWILLPKKKEESKI
ncbi:MAG: MltA domain-containing protein [Sulfurimonas sp.]|nr:MltA domain-containing protein [Sulfurimonas sp.]